MRPRKKQNTETMECCKQVVGCVTIIIYISYIQLPPPPYDFRVCFFGVWEIFGEKIDSVFSCE